MRAERMRALLARAVAIVANGARTPYEMHMLDVFLVALAMRDAELEQRYTDAQIAELTSVTDTMERAQREEQN